MIDLFVTLSKSLKINLRKLFTRTTVIFSILQVLFLNLDNYKHEPSISMFVYPFIKQKDSTNSFTGKKEVVMTDEETRLIKVDSTEVEPTTQVSLILM